MKNVRVLIVEDDSSSAYTIRRMLADEGHVVVGEATSGKEAIALALSESPDIVLMDIGIEGELDGVETALEIQKTNNVPIVYLTGHSEPETVERAKRSNSFAFVLKPFTKRELAVSIELALFKSENDRKLKESEYRLSNILRNISSGIISTDIEGAIQYMNPVAEVLTETSFERAEGKMIDDIVEIRGRQVGNKIESIIQHFCSDLGHSSDEEPFQLSSLSGNVRITDLTGSEIFGPDGQGHGYVLVLHDVTEQFHAQNHIRMMATAMESLEDSVLLTDVCLENHGPQILNANRGFERTFGWQKEEIIGRSLDILESIKNESSLETVVAQCIRKGFGHKEERHTHRFEGEDILTEWTISVVNDDHGRPSQLVFIIRDMTQVRILEESLRESQKIEAVGCLAGGIAHDFNNLLTVINSYSELLSIKVEESDPNHKYVHQIRSAGKKSSDLVSQLMTFGRREEPTPRVLDLGEVTESLREMLGRVIREDIELETQYQRERYSAKADQGQIEQILINLCVNASDAMPKGGKIKIGVAGREIKPGEQSKKWDLPAGRYALLSVEDTGCGMDEATRKKIFDPFFTTKEVGKGTGLGLSTVFGIVRQSGGYIEVISAPGEGTRFAIYLPAVSGSTSARVEETEEASPSEGTESVLVVEDDETFSDCMQGLLRMHGYEVYSAGDGREALDKFREKAFDFNLLITDIVLPRMSGRELARQMVEINPAMKVIFMTGYDDEMDDHFFGPDSVLLEKPFSLSLILSKVRETLDGLLVAS